MSLLLPDQLDFFMEIEKQEHKTIEDKEVERKGLVYKKWLELPDETIIAEGTPERNDINNILWEDHCKLYQSAYHKCNGLPNDEYIWLNVCNRDYWVLNKIGGLQGEHIEICPYCGAELGKGKGNIILYKAEAKYWLFYLYYDIPMYERGFRTEEEKRKIREVWG